MENMNRIRLVAYWEDVIIRKHRFEEIDEDDNLIRESEVLDKEEIEVVDSGIINTILETEIDSIFFKDKLKKFKDEIESK